ncbi:protein FAM163A [Scophthalmus maximus]|uniref:Family with sequence similarity 163 member A n=1 Tax=Scophthalmus maximus TaxID=52904 RepID=A0A8D3DCT2_SCOMX|nr:protein FAM163A [Scophthalmus maximus]XP_035504489.1 protein FAM163A [Scophthalmus maximus]XP_035504491.1 protein FAM163A [Scophthalmus maximus]XP_035504492.1 protein FAM163A [Scophthalmus maximus]
MTAGTVVITGGILATVILLCIIAVLCYCRLQYYCCKKNGSDSGSISQQHFACNACSVTGLDGSLVTPLSLSPAEPARSSDPTKAGGGRRSFCPSCSPYDSPFYIRSSDEMRNGGERITYMPTHYENQALAMPLPAVRGSLLRETQRGRPPDFYTNTRAISTEV